MINKLAILGFALFCLQSTMVYANCTSNHKSSSLFGAVICSGANTSTYSGNTLQGLIDQFDEDELRARFGKSVNPQVDQIDLRLDIRGLPMFLSFPDISSSKLILQIPQLGINETFNGSDRDASADLLEEYWKTNAGTILKELTRVSPVDPVAGNPSSLQMSMINNTSSSARESDVNASGIGLGASFGRYTNDGRKIDVLTLPFSYSFKMGKKDELTIRLPVSYSNVEGAKSYQLILGLNYKRLLNNRWSLTPSLSYGAVGSIDLGTAAQMAVVSITSQYLLINRPKYSVRIGNMIGYSKSLPLKLQDYSVDINLQNTILRNGVSLAIPLNFKLAGRHIGFETLLTNTLLFGDELYADNYTEIGFSLGFLNRSSEKANFSSQVFGVGLKYLYYDQGHGFSLYGRYNF